MITVGVLSILIIIVYARVTEYPFVRWDDGMLIYDNPAIRSVNLRTLKTIFTTYDPELYVPLTLLSYQMDYLIGGIHSAMYHLQNILWHFTNASILTWLLHLLFIARTETEKSPVALGWIALGLGCLFAVHPINVETVAWASARKDLLSTAFALAAMLCYLPWISTAQRRWYYASLVLFTAGLLSKVTIISLPLMLLIIDLWCRRQWNRDTLLEKIPFILLSLVFGTIAIFGKSAQLLSVTLWETVLVIGKAIMFTLSTWLVPIHLSVLYPYNASITITSPAFAMPIISLLGLFGLLCLLAYRKRTLAPLLCASLFLLPLLPSLLNFSKGGTIYISSDRYAYLPSLGILLGIGLCIDQSFRTHFRLVAVIAGLYFTTATGLAMHQTQTWSGSEALFRNVLKHYPDAHIAHNNLANFLSERARAEGNVAAAIKEYERALEINRAMPESTERSNARSKILSNMASAYRQTGDTASARVHYREALRWSPVNPYALVGLGILAGSEGDLEEALRMYETALTTAPRFSPVYLNLGSLYASQGELHKALAAFDTAIDIDPFLPQAHFNRGVILQKLGKGSAALHSYKTAVDLAPIFVAARINLGLLEANRGKYKDAAAQFMEVLRIDPENRKAKEALSEIKLLNK
jgi:Tfp pilus assembly protein PilF